MHEAPLRIVTPAWWRLVVRPNKTIDRRAYTFCALQATHAAFKRHDLYVVPSQRSDRPPRCRLCRNPKRWRSRSSEKRAETPYARGSPPVAVWPTTCRPRFETTWTSKRTSEGQHTLGLRTEMAPPCPRAASKAFPRGVSKAFPCRVLSRSNL
jgi:hypothetical protein